MLVNIYITIGRVYDKPKSSWSDPKQALSVYVSAITCALITHCDEAEDCPLAMFLGLPVDLSIGCCYIKILSQIRWGKYCPSSLFTVEPPFFLIAAIVSFTSNVYVCPLIRANDLIASPHPMTWFLSRLDQWLPTYVRLTVFLFCSLPLTLWWMAGLVWGSNMLYVQWCFFFFLFLIFE